MKTKSYITIVIGVILITSLSSDKAIPAVNNNRISVFVGFRNIPGPSEQALVRRAGGQIRYSYNIVPAIAASVPEQAIQGLANNPNITYIEPDAIAYAIGEFEPDVTWGVDRIDAEQVWPNGFTGAGVKVAVIDTGIDYSHTELDDNYSGGKDFVNDDDDPFDDEGHGTHVAGTIAAEENGIGVIGVAPDALLYAVKVLGSDGYGSYSDVIAGIQWCIGKVDVINMSLGGPRSRTLQVACNNANASGIIIVAAAGNNGSAVIYPAAYSSVIAVSATDIYDDIPWWSNFGRQVELAAPGVDVISTYPGGYAIGDGTSMASPHVAGVAALVLQAYPDLSNEEVRDLLDLTSEDLGPIGKDSYYGYGLVDAEAAVGGSSPPPPPPPPSGEDMYVSDITMNLSSRTAGKNNFTKATATVIITDGSNLVSGATVYGSWSGATKDSDIGITDSYGMVTLSSDEVKNASPGTTYTFTVTNVTHPDYSYSPALNVETYDSKSVP